MAHSVDFHAATGPGRGAHATQTDRGDETMVTSKALKPGIYVYHCATPSAWPHHITSGMYGLILVKPQAACRRSTANFYVMQGELYTVQPFGTQGEWNVRIFFGVGGPNFTSSFQRHRRDIRQRLFHRRCALSPAGRGADSDRSGGRGATIVDFKIHRGGHYVLVNALSHAERGLTGYLIVDGPEKRRYSTQWTR